MTEAQVDDFKKSLVFVVGAGASCEVKLPAGGGLKNDIASHLSGVNFSHHQSTRVDGVIQDAIYLVSQKLSNPSDALTNYSRKAQFIAKAMPLAISIDNFIDNHRDDKDIATCGKFAIARCILHAESNSMLFVNQGGSYKGIDFSGLENTWFIGFFKLITENCHKSELRERFRRVAVVCFNYDRCIEHFLYFALCTHYGIESHEAAEIIGLMSIYHPYGKVGSLPWMLNAEQKSSIDFGLTPSPQQLVDIANQIRTFTEGTDPTDSEIDVLRRMVRLADRLVFLGFAYHPLNLKLLFSGQNNEHLLSHTRTKPIKVFGTSKNISFSDAEIIRGYLNEELSSGEVRLADESCAELISNYSRSLSLV